MITVGHRLGNIAFWLLKPLIALAMCPTTRTRVLVCSGDEILVVKGWLGDGRWLLPGGGLHSGELGAAGAVREVSEETGLQLEQSSLHLLADEAYIDGGFRYRCLYYAVDLPNRPEVRKQPYEIVDIAWLSPGDVSPDTAGMDVRRALELAAKL